MVCLDQVRRLYAVQIYGLLGSSASVFYMQQVTQSSIAMQVHANACTVLIFRITCAYSKL